ncbi:MAG: DUF2148 domain-containing protein [Bacteroidales bacterium]|jgi:uncharacterized ferredoxin-like protein|nr:DUF2148 domain-containing protein [Bacteroidales bacterium]
MISEAQFKIDAVINIAGKMAVAARTAPKGKGRDNLEIKIATDSDLLIIADKMEEIGKANEQANFLRDANNIRNSEAVVLIGTKIQALNLKVCGLCGMENCENKNKHPQIPCAFNTNDLGVAIGSAVSIAMDNRIDNRIMYTVGMAVRELRIFSEETRIIIGIALSVSGKNIFFDRKQ